MASSLVTFLSSPMWPSLWKRKKHTPLLSLVYTLSNRVDIRLSPILTSKLAVEPCVNTVYIMFPLPYYLLVYCSFCIFCTTVHSLHLYTVAVYWFLFILYILQSPPFCYTTSPMYCSSYIFCTNWSLCTFIHLFILLCTCYRLLCFRLDNLI